MKEKKLPLFFVIFKTGEIDIYVHVRQKDKYSAEKYCFDQLADSVAFSRSKIDLVHIEEVLV